MKPRNSANGEGLKPITIRIRPEDYTLLREHAEAERTSLNTVVSEAIAQYGLRIRREQAFRRIEVLQRQIRDAHGVGSDSVELLRELREERAEHLASFGVKREEGQKGEPRP